MSTTRATCHCGAVELRLILPRDGLAGAHCLTRSFCRRRAAGNVSVPLDRLEVVRGADKLTLYQCGTPGPRNTGSVPSAGSTPITSAARTLMNRGSTSAASRG